eukprot:5691616-Pleurochrysis_carterae.AAC.1
MRPRWLGSVMCGVVRAIAGRSVDGGTASIPRVGPCCVGVRVGGWSSRGQDTGKQKVEVRR